MGARDRGREASAWGATTEFRDKSSEGHGSEGHGPEESAVCVCVCGGVSVCAQRSERCIQCVRGAQCAVCVACEV